MAPDADKALELLAATPTAVALCDIRMPGPRRPVAGGQLRREHPETAVIIATGAAGRGPAVESLRPGRRRLPDQAVRARPSVRSGVAGRGVAPRRRAIPDDGASGSKRKMHARRAHLDDGHRRSVTSTPTTTLDVLLSMLTATNRRGVRARAIASRRSRPRVARSARTSAEPDVATLERGALLHESESSRCPKRCCASRRRSRSRSSGSSAPSAHRQRAHRARAVSPPAAAVVRDAHERLDGLGLSERQPRRRRLASAPASSPSPTPTTR